MNLLLVMLGGALGTGGRYLLGGWLNAQAASGFPWGTLGVNLLGSLAIGAVFGLARQGAVPPGAILFLTVGVLGGFTTFSTFSYETLRLLADGSPGASFLNAAVQLAGGLAAVYAGFAAVKLLG